ncbi:MAG: FG-GAP-like repeat-containing protein, partial [Bryobacteraceae bacterium]
FQPPAYVPRDPDPAPGFSFHALSIIDIDGDGNADIAGGAYGSALVVFFGNGNGTFRAPVDNYLFSTDLLVLADFNRDGIIDVADATPISMYLGALSPLLTLTASPNPANFGEDVVLTISSSFADATGTISFTDASTGTALGSAPLSNGAATFRITRPTQGNHVYQAEYSGDSKYAAATAPLISVLVQETVGITLSASPNPALPGQPVTLTATLSPFPGNANVIFLDGEVPLDYQELFAGPNPNQVTFTTTLAAGLHQLRVVFPAYQGYEYASASYAENVVALGGGQLIQDGSYEVGVSPNAMAAADFTGDGVTDIAVASSTGQSLSLFSGTGLGKFQTTATTALGFAPGAMVVLQFQINYGPELAVTDPANNAVHTFNYAGGRFSQNTTLGVGTQPVAIAAADFDGDGILDLITANAGSNNMSVLLSNKPALTLPAGTHPDAVVTGDFNNDGNADFAVANRDDNTVSIFLGNGDGSFQTPTTLAAGGGPVAMVAGDLNGDGKTDIAIVDGGSGQITILLANGNGTFNTLPAIGAAGASAITLAELTGSGHLDLAVTTSSGLLVYAGNGDGTFQPPVNYARYAGGTAILAEPFVLNGRMSLAVAISGANSVSLLLNEIPTTEVLSVTPPQGVTGGNVTFTINVTPAAAIGWFTCYDGAMLVGSGQVVNGQGSFSTSLLLPGTHSFSARFDGIGFGPSSTAAVPYTVTSVASLGVAPAFTQNLVDAPANLVPGDFNNDGIEDFAAWIGGYGPYVFLGNGDGTFQGHNTGGQAGTPAVTADFNRDGFTDLASSPVYPLVAAGDGTGYLYPQSATNAVIVTPTAVAAADVDGDTIPDLILANPNGTVDVLLGIGDATFQMARIYPAGSNPTALATADLNEDGIPDIIVANNISSAAGALNVLLGTGGGGFANPQTLVVGATPVSMVVGDFNGDRHADVALLHAGSNIIALFPGKGDGTFSAPSTIVLPASPVKILAADMNSDGIPDLIVLFATGSPAFAILNGNGDGTFQSPTTFQDARIPIDFAVGDVNNDGRMDVVVSSQSPDLTAQGVDVFLGAAQALSVLQGSGQSAGIGTAFPNILRVHAAPGAKVTFSAPSSGPSGSFGSSGTSAIVTADLSGNAIAPAFTANSHAGTYIVTATAAGFLSVNFNLTNTAGPPATFGLVTTAVQYFAAINAVFANPPQVIVLDAAGNPVPNITVTFATTTAASGATATFAGGVSTATSVTNVSGIATSPTVTANGVTGSYFGVVSVVGVGTSDYFGMTNWPIGQIVVTNSLSAPGSFSTGGSAVAYAVDGISYNATHIFYWTPGDTHTFSIPAQSNGPTGYAFTGWSDGGAATHVYTVPTGAATITASFKTQYELLVDQLPGGTITPGSGYFDPGSPVTVTATPDPGYAFLGFVGGGAANPGINNPVTRSLSFNLSLPSSVYASFAPLSEMVSAEVSHTGNFTRGQSGATYSVVISNGASGAPTGFFEVTATEVLPAGLTLISMAGAGWNCAANTCTRFDSLAPGASYPAITVTVNVASNAPSQVTNQVTVSAGNQGAVASGDATAITSLQSAQTITFGILSNQSLGSSPPALGATASSGLAVTFVSNTTAVCTVSGVNLTLVAAGTCSITASQAGNATWAAAPSITRSFTVSPPAVAATAAFVATDTTTQGAWKGVYGADGEAIYDDSANYPSYAQVYFGGDSSYVWASSGTDVRDLQKSA